MKKKGIRGMTVALEEVSGSDFDSVKRQHIEAVSAVLTNTGAHTHASAVAQAAREFDRRLPAGIATRDNHFFHISESGAGTRVGYLWLALEERHGDKVAFIYGIAISSGYRGRGYGQVAMGHLERIVASLGITKIVLHARGNNHAAISLYKSVGYSVDALSMSKSIKA